MQLLNESEIESNLEAIDVAWSVIGGQTLTRVFKRPFDECVALVSTFAAIANELNHHPEMHVSYDKIEISLTSHDAGGLTNKDFEFAKRVDQYFA